MEWPEEINQALRQHLLYIADDELILAHRDSEWTGHAPILEEDIAFANIAQDELGHATIWYQLLEELSGEKPDDLVFLREASSFRNCQIFELPNGDWARSMVRQFLFDAYELVRGPRLAQCNYEPLAQAAAKVNQEEIYHYRHTSSWIRRLGWGTTESNQRVQSSVNDLWPFLYQIFGQTPGEIKLVEEGIIPSSEELKDEWESMVIPFLEKSNLKTPKGRPHVTARRDEHTSHLFKLVTEMQEVARYDQQAQW